MNDLVASRGSSLIFVSHDLPVIATMTESVLVMNTGKVVEHANVSNLFAQPQHDYSKKLIATAKHADELFTSFKGDRR
jgi:peptide/nickel transport system ATP-binding protein